MKRHKINYREFIGKRFGRVTITDLLPPEKGVYRDQRFVFKCECGESKSTKAHHIVTGRISSCGCLQREETAKRSLKHGHSVNRVQSKLYRAWAGVVNRTTRPERKNSEYYIGRGISIFKEWLGEGGFERFAQYMGEPPTDKHTVDRIDNDGNYEPGNVRWATRSEQSRNRSDNVFWTHGGITLCITDWATKLGISRTGLWGRVNRLGWSIERSLTDPLIDSKYKCKI